MAAMLHSFCQSSTETLDVSRDGHTSVIRDGLPDRSRGALSRC